MNAWPCVPVVSYSSVNWPGAMRATAISLPLGRWCVVSRACVSSTSPPPPVLGFSLAVAARVVLCVWPLVRPPSPPLNVSFSLADIQFEWLAAAG